MLFFVSIGIEVFPGFGSTDKKYPNSGFAFGVYPSYVASLGRLEAVDRLDAAKNIGGGGNIPDDLIDAFIGHG